MAAAWSLSWGESTWVEEDLTGRHVALVCAGLGREVWDVSPVIGPVHLVAVLAAFIAVETGELLLDVVQVLHSAPWATLLAALTLDG